ncbi:hypothetical protein NKG94_17310 [Micromonospora sp. M12]
MAITRARRWLGRRPTALLGCPRWGLTGSIGWRRATCWTGTCSAGCAAAARAVDLPV